MQMAGDLKLNPLRVIPSEAEESRKDVERPFDYAQGDVERQGRKLPGTAGKVPGIGGISSRIVDSCINIVDICISLG